MESQPFWTRNFNEKRFVLPEASFGISETLLSFFLWYMYEDMQVDLDVSFYHYFMA